MAAQRTVEELPIKATATEGPSRDPQSTCSNEVSEGPPKRPSKRPSEPLEGPSLNGAVSRSRRNGAISRGRLEGPFRGAVSRRRLRGPSLRRRLEWPPPGAASAGRRNGAVTRRRLFGPVSNGRLQGPSLRAVETAPSLRRLFEAPSLRAFFHRRRFQGPYLRAVSSVSTVPFGELFEWPLFQRAQTLSGSVSVRWLRVVFVAAVPSASLAVHGGFAGAPLSEMDSTLEGPRSDWGLSKPRESGR